MASDGVTPQDDRTVGTSEPPGDLRDRGARLQEVDRASTPALQLFGTSLWPHVRRVYERHD